MVEPSKPKSELASISIQIKLACFMISAYCVCSPDISLLCGGCMVNRWSSTCSGVRKGNTCSARPSRWEKLLCGLVAHNHKGSWSHFHKSCFLVVDGLTWWHLMWGYDKPNVRFACYIVLCCGCFSSKVTCTKPPLPLSVPRRVTWRHRSMLQQWRWWTLTTIKMWREARQTNSTVSSNLTSASS